MRVTPEVFVAEVEAADPGPAPVDDHDLAVVAEVQVQPAGAAADHVEGMDLHAACTQRADIGARQAEAAERVVQQVHAHAGRRALEQPRLHFAPDAVVAQDVELHQQVLARRRHRRRSNRM